MCAGVVQIYVCCSCMHGWLAEKCRPFTEGTNHMFRIVERLPFIETINHIRRRNASS